MPKPSLCLNMIVRNEADRIERCLASAAPYIRSAYILDTGSTDDTIEKIEVFCRANDISAVIRRGVFRDFSQARNDAFGMAQIFSTHTGMPFTQFALLMDADMELRVTHPGAFGNLNATDRAYDMVQKAGGVAYPNRRILNLYKNPDHPYVGVTHEYIDVDSAGTIEGAFFQDHADGSNRSEKFERDARLLEADLKTDPENGRSWYYLGNTYRDGGEPAKAADAYQRRIELGGWDEETHSTMMNLACCFKDQGDDAGYVSTLIDAFSFRPRRAEPLYDLANYYREKGQNGAGLIFAKMGMNIKQPNDLLFVNEYVYSHGLRFEYSILGYYDEAERKRTFAVTDDLALDPTCPANIRANARSNLFWHTAPLSQYCPSFTPVKLNFTPPEGYVAMNPSVEECNGKLKCNVRCVNYTMDQDGRYLINKTGCESNGTNPIDTRNFLVKLDDDFTVRNPQEIIWTRSASPAFDLVTGLEDVRLYRAQGELWFNACVRELSPNGTCQQARGQLVIDTQLQQAYVHNFQVMSGEANHEKNWMHIHNDEFMYRIDTMVVAGKPELTGKFNVKVYAGDISGSSQLIPFKSGWIAVVHEAISGPDGKRTYWHRFAWFEKSGQLRRLSIPFVFFDRQIEFCAGIAYHPNQNDLVISFGVRDAEAWVAKISIEEVAQMCWKFHED